MVIYTNPKDIERIGPTAKASVNADLLLDVGAHDMLVETLHLMAHLEDSRRSDRERWKALRAQVGTTLAKMNVDLEMRLRDAIIEDDQDT